MSNVRETLIAARTLIRNPDRWCQRVMARDGYGHEVDPSDPRATQFCAVGAYERVIRPDDPDTYHAGKGALMDAAGGPVRDVCPARQRLHRPCRHPQGLRPRHRRRIPGS